VSISTSRYSVAGYEPVLEPGVAPATRPGTAPPGPALFRLRSAQPSRRAVLHLQAAGDPVVPADLASWFTERACHFYLVGLRRAGRGRAGALAELDAACARLRDEDGIEHVILSAQGRAALAAVLWSDRKQAAGAGRDGARDPVASRQPSLDALILYQPAWPARRQLRLSIGCPVLVLSGQPARPPLLRVPRQAPRLGLHVTWRQLPELADAVQLPGPGRRAFLDELGRWLGAYMYGLAGAELL
jgi:hypothetical protein